MQLDDIHIKILKIVDTIGDPLLSHIKARTTSYRDDEVRVAVRSLVQQGYLRMKEDDYDHDWTYRLTQKGQEALGAK